MIPKPWCIIRYRVTPGPGAAGNRPRYYIHVFPDHDTAYEAVQKIYAIPGAHVLSFWVGDPRYVGAQDADQFDFAPDPITVHEGCLDVCDPEDPAPD